MSLKKGDWTRSLCNQWDISARSMDDLNDFNPNVSSMVDSAILNNLMVEKLILIYIYLRAMDSDNLLN